MKVSRFSNGHEDTYKGRRDVRAGWMLILPDGTILSGHSLDRAKAESTAKSNAATLCPNSRPMVVGLGGRIMDARTKDYVKQKARAAGFRTYQEWERDRRRRRAEFVSQCTIEVVDL